MRILNINTNDIRGGAARAAYRLHTGLRLLDQDSLLFVARQETNDPTVVLFEPAMDFIKSFRRRLRRERIVTCGLARYRKSRPIGYDLFSDDRSEYESSLVSQLPFCDIINLHWIASFVDYKSFFTPVCKHTPVVWTLHDMNAFTGGCHYDEDCGKYKNRCGSCPQLGSSNRNDLSKQIWQRKRSIFSRIKHGKLHIVVLNHWMEQKVKNSPLLGKFPVTIIPNGLDTEVFAPRDRRVARDALEVPQDSKLILFIAGSLTNRRKGFALMVKALLNLGDLKNLFLISLGRDKPSFDLQIPYLHLGQIDNDRLLSLVYSAADLFVITSLQDNLPNTVLESLACGTPVIGFDVGGIPEMVRPGISGFLAPPLDVDALRASISRFLTDTKIQEQMKANCRRIAVEEYSLGVQARSYFEFYKQILDRNDNTLT